MDTMNENREVSIQISGVKKMYKLGQIGRGTLQEDLQSWWARVRGKEDPNSKIGQDERLVGKCFMALNGIDLTIYKGEALGIIGANGAGKSTLLKLLCRVTGPTEGEIDLYGRVASMLEVKTGFNGEMTGRENIYMRGAILGMTKAEIDSKMEQIIDFSEIREFIDTPVKRYSSGMRVKLGFSVSAHLDSEIMIMDEVLAVGDMAFQKKCLEKMREVAKVEGRTVLYVSHNMNTIRQLCDRCILLDQGKIIFDGDVEEAIELYIVREDTGQTWIDYTNIPRLYWLMNTKIRTERAEFLDKDNSYFDKDEQMKISLQWVNEQDVSDLCLRMEILKPDRSPIGTAFLFDFYSGKKGKRSKVVFSFDTSLLSPGKYTCNFTYFERNQFGTNVNVDCVHGLYFVINADSKIVWKEKAWGNVMLPPLKLLDRKEKYI